MTELVAFALRMFAPLAGLATAICALELLAVREALSDRGVFAWPVLRRELAGAPAFVRAMADALFGYRGTCALLVAQLGAAVLLAFVPDAWPAWVAFATSLAISVRFRGTYNGGSDAMLLVVLGAIAVVRSAPSTAMGAKIAEGALAYVAAQLVLSYFIAGIAKLQDARWRRGRALPILVALPQYRVPPIWAALLSHGAMARVATYAMLGFELASPLALFHPVACVVVLGVAAAFHLGNALVFGLDRFWWTWIAAFPALLYWTSHRS